MKFDIKREHLLKPLQDIISIADKKHTMSVLNNIYCEIKQQTLKLKASDLETEIIAEINLEEPAIEGRTTIPARKLIEIIRNLPQDAKVSIQQESENRVTVSANRSRFALASLDPSSFPQMDHNLNDKAFTISQEALLKAIKKVQFAMAHNDVRYFLNGTLWEIENNLFRTVATDGHRMAMYEQAIDQTGISHMQIIVPRKAIVELQKLITNSEEVVSIHLGTNHFMVKLPHYTFTSKLIDGRYPDYNRVVPQENHKRLVADLVEFKQALTRTAILSNEKYRGVRLNLDKNVLHLAANNPEQEEASDEMEVEYTHDAMEVGFNVGYLLDVVNVIETEQVDLFFSTANMSLLIREHEITDSCYVIMPIRL